MARIRRDITARAGEGFSLGRAVFLFVAALAALSLSACLPNQNGKDALRKDFVDAAVRQNALAALSFSRTAQQALSSNPDWVGETIGSGSFDSLGISVTGTAGLTSGFKAGYCRNAADVDGKFREVLTIWPESVDAATFALKGLGKNIGPILSQEMASMAGNGSVGIMRSGTLVSAGWTGWDDSGVDGEQISLLPSSCDALALPEGTPVLVMEIKRDTAGTQAASRLAYSFTSCDVGENGAKINATLIHTLEDGSIAPDPEGLYRDKCF